MLAQVAQVAQLFTADLRFVLTFEGLILVSVFAWALHTLLNDLMRSGNETKNRVF